MQAQTTGSRWFGFNWMAVLALAICALAIAAAVAVLSDAVDLPFTSENQAVSSSTSDAVQERRLRYIEQKFQLPDISPVDPAQSAGQQTTRPNAARPADRSATVDWSGTIRANRGDHRATSSELNGVLVGPIQSVEQMRFLEENLWNVGPADTSTEATAVHPDTYPGDGLD